MRRVLWATLALMTALGLQPPSAHAQLKHNYSSSTSVIVPGATTTAYSGLAVNRNAGSPYKGYLYVCETLANKQVLIYAYDANTQSWADTGMRVTPSSTTVKPLNVAVAPDDSIWFLDWDSRKIESAPHPTPTTPNVTATTRVTLESLTSVAQRGIAVTGDITNAKVYVTRTNRLEGHSVTGATSTMLFRNETVGYFGYGVTVDAAGAVCVPVAATAGLIRRYDPLTGAAASPSQLAPKAAWMSASLYDLEFVYDAAYPGGGYFLFASRTGPSTAYKMAVYRFAGDGTYIDGFGPANATAVNYAAIDIPYPSAFSGAYIAPDADGSVLIRSYDGANGNVVRLTAEVAPITSGPWGDVNADGRITPADAAMVEAYIADPTQFTGAQQDRIQRYGDVNDTLNRNTIGNDTVDAQDTRRMALLAGGMIDAGTAGPAPAKYGDINDDGRVDILDAVLTQRAVNSLGDAATIAIVETRGRGDISPTVPFVSFGDRDITQNDADVIRARAFGTETTPPAYSDFWPMHAPSFGFGTTPADTYTFTDTTGKSGDMMSQILYLTQTPIEVNGYTVTEVQGTDDSKVGVYKGLDGSVYAMYLKYPYAFGNRLLTFDSPMKVFDQSVLNGAVATWSGRTSTTQSDLGFRPVSYKGALLAREDVYTPAAGAFTAPTDSPKSTWSQTARVRLDVAVLAGPTSSVEMQQAFFFDLMPFIGIVQRGQASHMGAAAPMTDRPLLRLDAVKVRGTTYNEMTP